MAAVAAVAAVVEALERDGYAVVEALMAPDDVSTARAELADILTGTPFGRDAFEGHRTRRVYGLFAKTRSLDRAVTHPLVLGVLDRVLGNYQLGAPAAIEVGSGEGAQPLHRDDAIYPVAVPHPELVCTVMWPLDDFTEANGATRMVPASHRAGAEQPGPDTATVAAEMPAGSALFYLGSLWHGAGPNTTSHPRLGVVLHYSVSWLRPVENHVLAVPPQIVSGLPVRLQELLGYNICPPFIGYVDGRHPRRALTPS